MFRRPPRDQPENLVHDIVTPFKNMIAESCFFFSGFFTHEQLLQHFYCIRSRAPESARNNEAQRAGLPYRNSFIWLAGWIPCFWCISCTASRIHEDLSGDHFLRDAEVPPMVNS